MSKKSKTDAPSTPPTLRERLPYQVIESCDRESRFSSTAWFHQTPRPIVGRFWDEIPNSNRVFFALSGLCLAWLAVQTAGPPIYVAGQSAIFPYTAEGKRQTCLDNLRAIQQAVAQYSQDYNGRLPLLDARDSSGGRVTWVSLVKPRTEERFFQCPTGVAVPGERSQWTASYVFNPVLAGQTLGEADNPEQTLLLADGGTRHDVSLLPPFPTWPSMTAQNGVGFDGAQANLDFRHNQAAGAVYADGHAEPLNNSAGLRETTSWGGSAVVRRSLERLEKTNAFAGTLIARLRQSDVSGAVRLLQANSKPLAPTTEGIVNLWLVNRGEETSDSVEAIGWHLARALEGIGDGSARRKLNSEMSRRVADEWQRGQSAGNQTASGDSGYGMELPANWTKEEKPDGRYRRTFFRSGLSSIYALIEIGERTAYSETRPVAWDGMESELKGRYGIGYKSIRRDTTSFYSNTASLWEYEIEKAGSPRLHKLTIGYVSGWQSYIVAFTAPANDWDKWKPLFEKAAANFNYVGHGE